MFVLNGGPRAGQLVDDLPSGYRLLAGARETGPGATVVADVPAAIAVWRGETPHPMRHWSAP